jgi:cytochrome P450
VINGVTIPKGAAIIVPIAVLQQSPLYWEEPEKFDPDR